MTTSDVDPWDAAARQIAACYGVVDFDAETQEARKYWLDLVRSLANE